MRHLNELLDRLHLSEERGVLFRNKTNSWSQSDDIFNFEIIDKLNKINPDAVYHFNNQPFILFFDLSEQNQKTDKQIFKEVWSWDKVPVVFIVGHESPKVYNAFHYQKERDQLEEIKFNSEEKRNKCFSFWELQSGGTWKWIEENIYKRNIKKHRVNYNLFNNIKAARIHLSEEVDKPLSEEFANILILRLIFIRYLIDRDVIIDSQYISGNSIEEKRQSLGELILNHNLLQSFFNYLKDRFNGNLFETEDDPDIFVDHLNYLSKFFEADLPKKQYFIPYLNVFDFSIIPVETISGIYESVIDDKKRKENFAVYTPLFLVDYILNNTVDKHLEKSGTSSCKVLDPSVGSGIFLTQTLRRIVEKEIILNGKSLDDEKLKTLVINNLYGIDKDINALNVAAFSIYISILDYKEPKEIDNFQLPDLIGKNLIHNDFFNEEKDEDDLKRTEELNYHKYNEKIKEIEFSYILGNPPWGRKNDIELDYFHLKFKKEHDLPLSNDEIAQSFIFRSKDFHTKNTKSSLVITSTAFYNNWAKEFKNKLFKEYFIDEILDLSASRRLIFEDKISPAIILFYQFAFNNLTVNNLIKHVSIKANRFLKDFNVLVIGKVDKKEIKQKHFLDYPWMMKLALYGNTYDFNLLRRLSSDFSLKKYIDKKCDNVCYGDGIKRLTKNAKGKLTKNQLKKLKPFTDIANIPIIEREQINQFYSQPDKYNLPKENDLWNKSGERIEFFKGKRILLKASTEFESDLVISYIEKDSVFRHDIFGIISEHDDELEYLYGFFVSKLFSYYQYMISGAWGIATRPRISLSEYLSFPFIESKQKEKFLTHVEAFLNTYREYFSQFPRSETPPNPENLSEFKEINRIINETYLVNDIEKDMIDYVLDVSRYQFQEGKLDKILRPPTEKELKNFAQVFLEHYGNIYNVDNQYFQVEIYTLDYFVAMKFMVVPDKPNDKEQIMFGSIESEEKLFKVLSEHLTIYEVSNQIFIQKNVTGFEKDWFYLIKPNEYKSWHRAMAHYDIAEFDNEIIKAEIEEKMSNE